MHARDLEALVILLIGAFGLLLAMVLVLIELRERARALAMQPEEQEEEKTEELQTITHLRPARRWTWLSADDRVRIASH
jgi:hypothetical protein